MGRDGLGQTLPFPQAVGVITTRCEDGPALALVREHRGMPRRSAAGERARPAIASHGRVEHAGKAVSQRAVRTEITQRQRRDARRTDANRTRWVLPRVWRSNPTETALTPK